MLDQFTNIATELRASNSAGNAPVARKRASSQNSGPVIGMPNPKYTKRGAATGNKSSVSSQVIPPVSAAPEPSYQVPRFASVNAPTDLPSRDSSTTPRSALFPNLDCNKPSNAAAKSLRSTTKSISKDRDNVVPEIPSREPSPDLIMTDPRANFPTSLEAHSTVFRPLFDESDTAVLAELPLWVLHGFSADLLMLNSRISSELANREKVKEDRLRRAGQQHKIARGRAKFVTFGKHHQVHVSGHLKRTAPERLHFLRPKVCQKVQ